LSNKGRTSYQEIIKSSALIGGASAVNMLLGIVRTKVLAVLIGTEGMGLFGAFNSVTGLVSSITGMGITSSGVRQIAEAVGTNDEDRVARTVFTLRRTAFVLGLAGMVVLLAFARPISRITFGSSDHSLELALLSVTVLLTSISGGQTALVQGMRRIRDLAALNIWGAALGTVTSIAVIYVFRRNGIALFLIAVSVFAIFTSWWYARKIAVKPVRLPVREVWQESRQLLGMGLAFMASALMGNAVAYFTRVLVIREMNLAAAGLFQAAWTLSSIYVGFILSAMGADYYPRLTLVAADDREVNRLVNEQTEVALLMAIPGILGTLTFAPLVLHLLYSAQFAPAGGILRWQILGVLGRVISWPVGFVLLAKGCARTFFCTELAGNLAYLGMVWLGLNWFGLKGLGMAYLGMYLVYGLLVTIIVNGITGFRWDRGNLRLGGGALAATALVFVATSSLVPSPFGVTLAVAVTTGATVYAVRKIEKRLGISILANVWFRLRSVITKST
jgi:PST family polysaccharide transporter